MATSKSQRIGILIITVAMVVGTIGSFAVMILGTQNSSREGAENQAKMAELQKDYEEYNKKVQAQGDELSAKYYDEFSQYASRVGGFDKDGVKEVSVVDLKEGDGAEITDSTKYSAYYIGWNPTGKIFDQSISNGKLISPIKGEGLIPGWTEGMKGMKLGGVREITIPSDKAYGEQGRGDDIPPNTPLKFVVMAIERPADIPVPDSLKGMGI